MNSTGSAFMIGLVGGYVVKSVYSFIRSNYSTYSRINNYSAEMDDLAKECDSVDTYKQIVSNIFKDGFLSYGRLVGITLFTQSVCGRHTEIAEEIKSHYIRFITSLRLGASVNPNTEKPKDKNKV